MNGTLVSEAAHDSAANGENYFIQDFEPTQKTPLIQANDHKATFDKSTLLKLSTQRWVILFAMFILGTTTYLTDELSSILHWMLNLLELPLSQYIYINNLLAMLAIFTILPTGWFIDRFGIKVTMYVCSILVIGRNGAKVLLFNPDLANWKELKFYYWLVTTFCSHQILNIFFCLPLKISENWFSQSERALAWTVMHASTYLGFILASAILPHIIQTLDDAKILYYLNIAVTVLVPLICLACITKAQPDHPPSVRMIDSNAKPQVFYKSFKAMCRHRDIMLMLIYQAFNDGYNAAIITVLQDVLTSVGHDETFAGTVFSLTYIISLIILVALSIMVHRVEDKLRICRIGALGYSSTYFLLLLSMLFPMSQWIVLSMAILNRAAHSWANPNFNNMEAHLASGVITEATMGGVAMLFTTTAAAICRMLFVACAVEQNGRLDYTYSILLMAIFEIVTALAFLIFFEGKRSKVIQNSS